MRPGINPRSQPRPNRKARRRYIQWSPGHIEYMKNLTALRKMMQEDKKRMKAQVNGWRKAFSRLDKMKSLRMTDGPLYPVDYPPNDWMCGIRGPYATAPPVDDMGFGPLYEARKEIMTGLLFPMIRHQGLQIMYPPNMFRSSEPLGLFMDQEPRPRGSIMQEKLLEEEARRHFPLADAASRAAYVAQSIDAANEMTVERKREQAKRDGFDDYCEAHDLPYMDECPECANLIQPSTEHEVPPGMIKVWAADINDYVYTRPKEKTLVERMNDKKRQNETPPTE